MLIPPNIAFASVSRSTHDVPAADAPHWPFGVQQLTSPSTAGQLGSASASGLHSPPLELEPQRLVAASAQQGTGQPSGGVPAAGGNNG
jgi:hypothetical protein